MISKLCRVVTYDEEISPIISNDSLALQSREVTRKTKIEISSIAERHQAWYDGDI